MKKRNKGFTLIELLTVIAILAIILLIAAPTILGVLDKAKMNTFKNQVLLYVEALKTEIALSATGNSEMNLVLPDEGKTLEVDITKIPMESKTKLEGKILVYGEGKGKYTYKLLGVNDKNYCVGDNSIAVNSNSIITSGENSDIHKYSSTCISTSEEPEVSYTPYSIGDSVTLKDGSTWYVIKESDSSSEEVTLLSEYNFKKDRSGWSETLEDYKDYGIQFDSDNSNAYDESDIKEFIEGDILENINKSLNSAGGININSISLITMDDICYIINAADDSNSCDVPPKPTDAETKLNILYKNVPAWLHSTYYWTMISLDSNSEYVYRINIDSTLYTSLANADGAYGARPVIVTNKSNIQ